MKVCTGQRLRLRSPIWSDSQLGMSTMEILRSDGDSFLHPQTSRVSLTDMAYAGKHPVWKFFTVQQRQLQGSPKPVDYCICNVAGCNNGPRGAVYEAKGKYTTALVGHILTKHQAQAADLTKDLEVWKPHNKKIETDPNQSLLTGFTIGEGRLSAAPGPKKFKQNYYNKDSHTAKFIDAKLVAFLASTGVSYRTVESKEFREFVEALNPQYLPPKSHTTVSKWVQKARDLLVDNLVKVLADRWVCVIADIWSQRGLSRSLMGVTVSFFSPEIGQIVTPLLAVKEFPHPHTSGRIKGVVDVILAEFHIDESKVFPYVSDVRL